MDIAQLERRGFRAESNAIENMRKSGIVGVRDSFEMRLAVVESLSVLSPFGRASDVLSSFRNGRTDHRMVRVSEIQALITI